jgi:hypothetical protein
MSGKQTAQQRWASPRARRMRRNGLTSVDSFAGTGVASVPYTMAMRPTANAASRRHKGVDDPMTLEEAAT